MQTRSAGESELQVSTLSRASAVSRFLQEWPVAAHIRILPATLPPCLHRDDDDDGDDNDDDDDHDVDHDVDDDSHDDDDDWFASRFIKHTC